MLFNNKNLVLLILFLLPSNIYVSYKFINKYFLTQNIDNYIQKTYESNIQEFVFLNKHFKKNNPIVFAGDSNIRRYAVEEYFPHVTTVNRGIFRDTSFGLFNRWDSTIAELNPKKIFIMVGTNDIISGNENDIIPYMEKILNKKTYPSIYVLNIPPLGKKYCIHNVSIKNINESLKALVVSKKQYWIDMYADLTDEAGCLSNEYSDDGIHLNGNGYQILSSHLQKVIP